MQNSLRILGHRPQRRQCRRGYADVTAADNDTLFGSGAGTIGFAIVRVRGAPDNNRTDDRANAQNAAPPWRVSLKHNNSYPPQTDAA